MRIPDHCGYLQIIIDGLNALDFSADFHIPESTDELDVLAPGLTASVAKLSPLEQGLLFRCLGEAEATLFYENCDAVMRGAPLTPAARRRIFLQSFKERIRQVYGEVSASS